ncbi:MAG: holo-ACP synthase [Acidobacteria bacterium]|nr:holo-ACP synthase [Acidobacteriota bacterium]
MIVGLGIDQIEIARVARVWRRFGDRFGRRVYTQAEWDYSLSRPQPAESLAGRFAAKEAAMKALGRGWPGGIGFRDIEVTRERSGKPGLRFANSAARRADTIGYGRAALSMSHDRTFASATVLLEKG